MYGVSQRYLDAVADKVRTDIIVGEITFPDGDTIEVSEDNLVKNTLKLTKELCGSKYSIGTFYLSCLCFGLFLEDARNIDLTGATVSLEYGIAVDDYGYETVPLGVFEIDPVLSSRHKDTLEIVAYDRGVKFDREPSDAVKELSCTPAELIIAVCGECGILTDITPHSLDAMPNSSLTVSASDRQIQTCRDIIMWCAALLCGYAVIDRDSKLKIIPAKYSVSGQDSSIIITDRSITENERSSISVTDTRAYIKYLTAYRDDEIVNYSSSYVPQDEQASPAAYVLEKNPLLAGCADTVWDQANRAWLSYIDAFKQRGVKARIMGDPAIDAGDTIVFSGGDVDQRGSIIGVVTSYVWNFRKYHDIVCCAAECCGSIAPANRAGNSSFSDVRSQSFKRIDSIEAELDSLSSGVGENIGRHNERFNDYENNTIDPNGNQDYNKLSGYNNHIGAGISFACDVGGSENNLNGSNNVGGLVRGYNNDVGGTRNITSGDTNSNTGSDNITVGGRNAVSRARGVTYGESCSNTREDALCGGDYGFTGTDFMIAIGHGGFASDPKNIFTVDKFGDVTAHAYNTSSADFAEYFGWADGNPEADDRMGLLVDQVGDKIAPAQGDEFFGAISARASVVGNAYEDYWHGKYVTDVYGRVQYDEDGKALISPDFDPSRVYVPRSQRPEWAVTGLTGRIIVRDDGSCIPGGYVSARQGIAKKCYKKTAGRMLRRIDERHIEILLK